MAEKQARRVVSDRLRIYYASLLKMSEPEADALLERALVRCRTEQPEAAASEQRH